MKKRFEDIGGYTLDNPSVYRMSLSNHITIMLNGIFINFLKLLRRLKRISKSQERYLEIFECDRDFSSDLSNSPSTTYDSKAPFYNIERITVSELIPKEYANSTYKGLERFQKKYSSRGIFDFNHEMGSYFDSFNDGYAFSNIITFKVNEKSCLKNYIRTISFCFVNATDSFFVLNVSADLNKDFSEAMSKYATKNVEEFSEKKVLLNTSWYEYKRATIATHSGEGIKSKTIEQVVADLRWRLIKEIGKYVKHMCFFEKKIIPPGLLTVESNIDFTSNDLFWHSVGIYEHHCDRYNDTNLYLSFDFSDSLILVNHYNDEENKNSGETRIISHHLGEYLANYLVANKVNNNIRNELKTYSEKISKIRLKSTKKWLKVKRNMDAALFYDVRYISDFSEPYVDTCLDKFRSCVDNTQSHTLSGYAALFEKTSKTNALYNNLLELYQSNISYKTTASNDRLQRIAIVISIISIIIACVSVAVTVNYNDLLNFINSIK